MEIIGFPKHLVYEDGRVWSNGKKKFMTYHKDKFGYLAVTIRFNGKRKSYRKHRIIAEHFIPNPNNLRCVDHINGIKTDNRIENLRWVTSQDNTRNIHAIRSNTGYQGVSLEKTKTYIASFKLDNKTVSKHFKYLEDAVMWRREMVDKYYNRPQSS